MSGLSSGVTSTRTMKLRLLMSTEKQNTLEKSPTIFENPIFKIVFWSILISSVITFGSICFHDNITFSLFFGANEALLFINNFKLPLGIWAVGLPILLLLATQHRSEQTAEQIKLTIEANEKLSTQNTLKNYYDSITDFEKYVENNFHSDVIEIKNKRQLYKLFFPDNSYKNVEPYTIRGAYIQEVNKFTRGFRKSISIALKSEEKETPKLKFELLINHFILNIRNSYGIYLTDKGFIENSNAHDELAKLTKEVRELLKFCYNYTPSSAPPVMEGSYAYSQKSWVDFKKYINDSRNIEDFTVMKNKLDGFDGEITIMDPNDMSVFESYAKQPNFLNK